MATTIEWCDEVWNPVTGCTKVSAGCKNCYAATFARRGMGQWAGRAFGEVRCHEDRLVHPLQWTSRRRVFINSMSDLFHESVPFEFVDRVMAVVAVARQHDFLLLTKRPERMREYFGDADDDERSHAIGTTAGCMLDGSWIWTTRGKRWRPYIESVISLSHGFDPDDEDVETYSSTDFLPLPNLWLGVSLEDQAAADERIPLLLQTPAAVRWISAEPLLGPIDPSRYIRRSESMIDYRQRVGYDAPHGAADRIDWVVVGGESGSGARPCHQDWVRSIVSQCKDANVPVFVKQLGALSYTDAGRSFRDHLQWVQKAAGWIGGTNAILVDTQGRICRNGGDMARARDENAFPVRILGPDALRHPKGGDMSEWPKDLQVREWPR